ncbi:hypothetical protein THAOC_04149, partial [Thalassiosira oceanica]
DFHFKQGPKKKCDEIGMPKSLTTLILTYLDYARVLPRDDMKDKGIYYLQHLIYDETSSLPELDEGFPYAKWLVFWEYFERPKSDQDHKPELTFMSNPTTAPDQPLAN